jgi:hypothetical protein
MLIIHHANRRKGFRDEVITLAIWEIALEIEYLSDRFILIDQELIDNL